MIGCLGDDEFGARLRERLAGAGVGAGRRANGGAGLRHERGHPGGSGDYAAIVVSGANRDIDAAQVAASAAAIRDSRVLLLQHEVAEAANAAAAATRPCEPA